MSQNPAELATPSTPDHPLTRLIDRLARELPAQGPISIFIHHNTLHAFEHLPFEEAVESAAERLGREPFLPESRYREKLASGRILAKDVEALLVEQLGARADQDVAGVGSRLDLWRAIVLHGIPAAAGRELRWILEETDVLSRFRTDVPAPARSASAAVRDLDGRGSDEQRAVRRLWQASLDAAGDADALPAPASAAPVRHRDWLLAVHGLDTDAWIHPPLIRFLAGYLDQGLAHWSMPERGRGIHGCFLEIYRTRVAAACGRWARTLPGLVADDRAAQRSALSSIAHSLDQLGIRDDEYADYLSAELLSLRGWAGIVRQIEERPDRVPARNLTVTLRGYLAVRLLFERAALEQAAHQVSFNGRLSELRGWLQSQRRRPPPPTAIERAWPLFHVAQLCGLDPSIVERWTPSHVAELETRAATARWCALPANPAPGVRARDSPSPLRRPGASFHAESCRTAVVPGDLLHRRAGGVVPPSPGRGRPGVRDVRHRRLLRRRHVSPGCRRCPSAPLCPVAIRPEHWVAEVETDGQPPDRSLAASATATPPGSSATTCTSRAGRRSAAQC